MTSQMKSPADELRRIVAEGRISEDALQTITGIEPEKLSSFLGEARSGMALSSGPQALSEDESTRLSVLAAQLTDGLTIDDDERLKGILESLTIERGLTLQNLAHLTGFDAADLDSARHDPRTVPIEKRYELAIRGSYLINAINSARAR